MCTHICDLICKNPEQSRIYGYSVSCIYACALSLVILQYEACIINSFQVTVLGSSRSIILHLYANLQ